MRLGLILAVLLAFLSPAQADLLDDLEFFYRTSEQGRFYIQHELTESFIDDPEWADAAADPRFTQAFKEFKVANFGNAARLLPTLAEEGHAKAQLLLGILHYWGHGVEKSIAQALNWIKRADDQGLADAQIVLARIYLKRGGDDLAIPLLEQAAEEGHIHSQLILAALYHMGARGRPRDNDKAFKWLLRAAEAGEPFAMAQVAESYYMGIGMVDEQNIDKAKRWAHAAAAHNEPVAQLVLARIYWGEAYRSKTPTDYEKALAWYRLAAEQGLRRAQRDLSDIYRRGRGVPQDLVAAYMWAKLANDTPSISEMTPEQIAEGERRVRELQEKRRSGNR